MLTAIYALGRVVGAEIWLAGCLVCLLAAFGGTFAAKANRRREKRRTSVLGIVIPGLLCDLAWFFLYFPGGEYRNMGLAAAGGLLLYPICLGLGAGIASGLNAEG